MRSIEKSVIKGSGLTVYTAEGTVSGEEVKSMIRDFYEHGPITRNVLWDLTNAVLEELNTEDVRCIAHVPRKFLGLRQDGKTAIVAPSNLAYGLSRMYQSMFQSSVQPEELPFETQVFRDLEAAKQWLVDNNSP